MSPDPLLLEPIEPDPVRVAARLADCARRWHLEPAGALTGGARSHVFVATRSPGDDVVIKLAATPDEARHEVAALTAWADSPAAVELIDFDPVNDALLLARVSPGAPLTPGDDDTAVAVAAALLPPLHAGHTDVALLALEQTYPHWEARARSDCAHYRTARSEPRRGAAGLERLGAARTLVGRLCASTPRAVLLHGDFIDKNLLWDGARYVAIDPIPAIGDPGSDVGFFAAGHPPAAGILTRAAAIARRMDLDVARAQQWAVVWTILQTTQAWRPDQAALETLVSGSAFDDILHRGA